jgi:hypothetical protein
MTFRDLISTLLADGRASNVLFTLTPPAVRERTLALRLIYAGGVLGTFGLSLLCAASSAMLLLLSIGVIYYLMSQVLGLKIDFDPTVLIQPMQRQKTAPSAPN